jgi:hypothetical protein
MKVLSVFIVGLGPGPAARAKARTGGKPTVTAAAAVMRRTLRRDGIETFTGQEKMPVERISDQDASPIDTDRAILPRRAITAFDLSRGDAG